MLARLIMEQCVARLDVAMFNAILRESVDEIPTDPVSDPISDPKVLPIPAGSSSFGAGAQLKNVIGNWSRWLTDLFGMDDDDLLEDDNENDETDERPDTTFKPFHLLNALSDLMMLPKDMLLSKSIRKETSFVQILFQMLCLKPWTLRMLLRLERSLSQRYHALQLLRSIYHLQQLPLPKSLESLEVNLS